MPKKAAGGPCLPPQAKGFHCQPLEISEPALSTGSFPAQTEKGHLPNRLEVTTWCQVTQRDTYVVADHGRGLRGPSLSCPYLQGH